MTVLLPSGVARANLPLLLATLPAGAVYVLLHPRWRHLPGLERLTGHVGRRRHALWLLLWLAALFLVLGVALETYHARDCPNSVIFQYEIDALARWLYEFCWRYHLPYWLVFGNGLFVLRGQNRIPVGDTDSDIAVLKDAFLGTFGTVANFTRLAEIDGVIELQMDIHVVYLPERELLQIYTNPELFGAHADIWLYKPEGRDPGTGRPAFLVNEDRTIRAQRIPYDEIMPLRVDEGFFLNTPVTLPRHPEYLARAEYGASFMEPLVTRLECMENVWNGYCFYKTPHARMRFIAWVVVLSSTLTLAAAYGIGPLRHVLIVSERKRKASTRRGTDDDDAEAERFIDKDLV